MPPQNFIVGICSTHVYVRCLKLHNYKLHTSCYVIWRWKRNREKCSWENKEGGIKREDFPTVGETCKAVFWPPPGFKERIFNRSGFATEDSCVRSAPLRGTTRRNFEVVHGTALTVKLFSVHQTSIRICWRSIECFPLFPPYSCVL